MVMMVMMVRWIRMTQEIILACLMALSMTHPLMTKKERNHIAVTIYLQVPMLKMGTIQMVTPVILVVLKVARLTPMVTPKKKKKKKKKKIIHLVVKFYQLQGSTHTFPEQPILFFQNSGYSQIWDWLQQQCIRQYISILCVTRPF